MLKVFYSTLFILDIYNTTKDFSYRCEKNPITFEELAKLPPFPNLKTCTLDHYGQVVPFKICDFILVRVLILKFSQNNF